MVAKRPARLKADTRFQIDGLHGSLTVDIDLADPAMVFVGPNGMGKSTIISCLYFFLTAQWSRLASIQFDSVTLIVDGEAAVLTHDQCSRGSRAPFRAGMTLERIEQRLPPSLYSEFTSSDELTPSVVDRMARTAGLPRTELSRAHNFFRMKADRDPAFQSIERVEKLIATLVPGQILFLPTYRRIEQDFRALFPKLLEHIQRFGDQDLAFDRKTARYHEIIQFGMEDIQSLWASTSTSVQGYAKAQLSSLMSGYLRDVIRGNAAKLDQSFFRNINDIDVDKVLSRVEENALNFEDQRVLRVTVEGLRRAADPDQKSLYLGYFFQRLTQVVRAIEEREAPVRDLVDTLNGYFKPSKIVRYDPVNYAISIENDRGQNIDLGSLSSGEKQIVSLFSILFLGNSEGHWIIIDEPELSLSVPWQERFLDDVFSNPKCRKLVAVTHSPFVYKNALKGYARDISDAISGPRQ
jgi:energy-coupling factor transporter ATP-binding protein EcfA2